MPQTIAEDDRRKLFEKGTAQYLGDPGPSPLTDYQDVFAKGTAQYLSSDPLTPGPTTPPAIGAPSPEAPEAQEKPGLLSRAFSAVFSPPEFVQEEAARAGEATVARATSEGIGGGKPPPATILKDGKHVENPKFARYMAGVTKAGLTAGAIETGSGFLSPGVIALTLLSGGTSVLATRGIKSAQVLMKALQSGKASPAQIKQYADLYNKAGQSAKFWQNANKIVHTGVGAGFTAHGGSKAIEAIQEKDGLKLGLAMAEMAIGVGGGGASLLRPTQAFPKVDYGGSKPPLKSGVPRGTAPREAGPARPSLEQQRQRLGLGEPPKPKDAVIELTAEELAPSAKPGGKVRGELRPVEKPTTTGGLAKPPALVEGLKPSVLRNAPETFEADAVSAAEARLGPVPKDHVRIYRGEGDELLGSVEGTPDFTQGGFFTESPRLARVFGQRYKNAQIKAVDVPKQALAQWRTKKKGELLVPDAVRNRAEVIGQLEVSDTELIGDPIVDKATQEMEGVEVPKELRGAENIKRFVEGGELKPPPGPDQVERAFGGTSLDQHVEDLALRAEELGPIEGEGRRVIFLNSAGKRQEGIVTGRGYEYPGTVRVDTMLTAGPMESGSDLIRSIEVPIKNIQELPSEASRATIDVTPTAELKPPPAIVKSRSFPGRVKFDPENLDLDHSLSDFVRAYGLSRGKRPGTSDLNDIPAELWEAMGSRNAASGLYRSKKTDVEGFAPDRLLRLAREEGGFNLPPDMNEGDFLALVAEDYNLKKSGESGRTYSGRSEVDVRGIDEEFQGYARARQEQIDAEALGERTPDLTEADQPDVDAFVFPDEPPGGEGGGGGGPLGSYRVIFKDGTDVEVHNATSAKAAREIAEQDWGDSPVDSVHPLIPPDEAGAYGEVTDVRKPPPSPGKTLPFKKPGEEGYLSIGEIIESFFPKKRDHSAVESDPAYQELLTTRRLRAAGPTFWNRQRQFWVDLPLDTARRFLNKRYDFERLVGTSLENAEARAGAGELQAIVALEGFQDPRYAVDIAIGGTVPKMQVAQIELNEIRRVALAQNLQDEFTYFLEHTAWQRSFKIIQEKSADAFKRASDALHAGDLELAKKWRMRGYEYKRRLREGEVVPTGKTIEDIQRDLETFTSSTTLAPDDLKLLQDLSDRFFQDNGRYWKLLFDEELLSETVYKQGLVRGPEYIPMNRIHEKFSGDPDFGGLSHLNAAVRKSLKRFEGSSLASLDPFEAAFIWRTRAISDASRNRAMRLIFKSRELDPDGFGQYIVPLANDQRPPTDYTKFSFYAKGNKKSFALPNLVAAGLQNAAPRDVTMVNYVVRAGQAGLHAGAIGYNLGFALPNVARDVGRTVLLSEVVEPLSRETLPDLARYAKSWGEALRHVIRQDPQYQDFLWSGAAGGTLARNIAPMNWVIPPWVKNKGAYRLANIPGRVINTIPDMVNALEETSKMAAYVRLREKGFSEVDAAIEARRYAGTPDSKRKGYDGDTLNQTVMFWNVRQQGRLFAVKRFYEDPKRILQALIAAAIPALILYRWNASFRDKDGKPEIAHVPRHERRDNFVWLRSEVNPDTGRHLYFKMPIPHEMKWAWIPMNDVLNDTSGEMDVKMSQYVQGIASATAETFPLVPNLDIRAMQMGRSAPLEFARGASAGLNPVIGLPLEQLANLDFFRDIPIESRAQQNLAPEERFGPRTSETAVVAGRVMPEWMGPMRSPKRIEHAVRSFGGGAEMALELIDPLSKHWSPQPELPPRPGASELPVIGGAADVVKRRFVGGGYRDQVVEDYETLFYHYYAESIETMATFNKLRATPERAKEWLKEKPERAALYNLQSYIQEVRQRLKLFADQRWNIQYLTAISEEERSQRLLKNSEDSAAVLEAAQVIQRLVEEARSGGQAPVELTPPPAPQ